MSWLRQRRIHAGTELSCCATHTETTSRQIGVAKVWTSPFCGPLLIPVRTPLFRLGKSLGWVIIECNILLERAGW